jgi:hypothetical protein
MPRYNDAPLAQERLDLEERKLQQGERGMSLREAQLLLNETQMAQAATLEKIKTENEINSTISATIAMRKLSRLNPEDKNFSRDYAAVLAEHSDAADNKALGEVAGALKQRWVQHSEGQEVLARQRDEDAAKSALEQNKAFAPANIGKAGYDLNTTMAGFNTLANQLDKTNPDGAKKLRDAMAIYGDYATAVGKKALDNIGGTIQPPTPAAAIQPAVPTPTPTPVAATAPTPPAQIAASDASAFLQNALGKASTPATPPLQAAVSGLPDRTESLLTDTDETE